VCTSPRKRSLSLLLCMQVILESPKDGRQYMFELKDRLIRDTELDGLTEIPVKPSTDWQADQLENSVSPVLPGQSRSLLIVSHCV